MSVSLSLVSSLLEDLYLAVPASGHWQRFLTRLQQHSGASKVYLLLIDPDGHAEIPLQVGCGEDFAIRYCTEWAHRDVVLAGYLDAQECRGQDYVGHRSSVVADRAFFQSEIYKKVFRHEGDSQLCFAALHGMQGGLTGGLCLRRPDANGPFDDDILALLNVLAPHMKQALLLHRRLQTSQSMARLGTRVLGAFDISAILTSAKGEVLYMSPAAQRIVESGDGLRLSGGRLNARSPEDNSELQMLLGSTLAGSSAAIDNGNLAASSTAVSARARRRRKNRPSGQDGAMLVERGEGVTPLQLSCTPFQPDEALNSEPAALIFVADMACKTLPRSPLLRALYRLTPTESNLVDLLISGSDVKQAAIKMSLRETTTRFHLKEIFRKTGVRSQPSLLRLALTLPSTPAITDRQTSHLGDGVDVGHVVRSSH